MKRENEKYLFVTLGANRVGTRIETEEKRPSLADEVGWRPGLGLEEAFDGTFMEYSD